MATWRSTWTSYSSRITINYSTVFFKKKTHTISKHSSWFIVLKGPSLHPFHSGDARQECMFHSRIQFVALCSYLLTDILLFSHVFLSAGTNFSPLYHSITLEGCLICSELFSVLPPSSNIFNWCKSLGLSQHSDISYYFPEGFGSHPIDCWAILRVHWWREWLPATLFLALFSTEEQRRGTAAQSIFQQLFDT